MRVLRVYHAGRDPAHRARERALHAAGVEVTLVVPSSWPDPGSEQHLSSEPFDVVELPVVRPGDVNRHRHDADVRAVLDRVRPDVLDLHEEPVSLSCRQWLRAAGGVPVVGYTAQNVDKRFPPPFSRYERDALARLDGLYPCSRQAASVALGKGATGVVEVLPLGVDLDVLRPGGQRPDDAEVVLGLVGRLVPEKGVLDAVEVLAAVAATRPARLVLVGDGPLGAEAEQAATARGLVLERHRWQSAAAVASLYRRMHVLLVPSTATATWVEQFGRVVVEGQACGAVVAGYASGAIAEAGGDAALLVAEGDRAALAHAVVALLDDPDEQRRRRQAGLVHARALGWTDVAARQVALYERALLRPPHWTLSRSAAVRRARAAEEFGSTAALRGGVRRPFALPVLRDDPPWTRPLARALDRLDR